MSQYNLFDQFDSLYGILTQKDLFQSLNYLRPSIQTLHRITANAARSVVNRANAVLAHINGFLICLKT